MTVDAILETALRRDRWIVLAMLASVIGLAWAYLLAGAGMEMSIFEMTRMSRSAGELTAMGGMGMEMTAPAAWSTGYAALMAVMWSVMMMAMMLPSAAPMILLFAAINRKQRLQGAPYIPTGLFVLGYVGVWGGFSLAATGLQWGLSAGGLLAPGMALAGPALAGALLLAAGLYQLTPLKQACLRQCQSPLRFLTAHWRRGPAGALRMGLAHGAYCLGCCWFLMLLLFAGGVMNLFWIAGLALFVLFEKVVPAGHWLSYVAGFVLTGWGAWLLAHAAG